MIVKNIRYIALSFAVITALSFPICAIVGFLFPAKEAIHALELSQSESAILVGVSYSAKSRGADSEEKHESFTYLVVEDNWQKFNVLKVPFVNDKLMPLENDKESYCVMFVIWLLCVLYSINFVFSFSKSKLGNT